MVLQDKTLVCRDCEAEFTFTVGEQEFYREKGFLHPPSRCRSADPSDGGAKPGLRAASAGCTR